MTRRKQLVADILRLALIVAVCGLIGWGFGVQL